MTDEPPRTDGGGEQGTVEDPLESHPKVDDTVSLDTSVVTEDGVKVGTDTTDSPVIKTVARTVTPLVIVFGVYLTLFGTTRPGGAFQGGVVMASSVVLIAVAFGFRPAREWLSETALASLYVLGAAIFGFAAFGALLFGGLLMDLTVFPVLSVEDMVKLVEVGIASLVAGVIIGLVAWLASGMGEEGGSL